MPTRRLLLALLTLLAVAPAAQANDVQVSVMMDDDNLVYRSPAISDRTLDTMASLGVDTVRVTVLWSVVAERAQTGRANQRRWRRYHGAANPRSYPPGNWDRYDHLVRSAGARGMGVYFNVTGPGPAWCCKRPPRSEAANRSTWMPNPVRFKLFVEAVGKRYSGRYQDENFRGRPKARRLPRVSFWSLWNEPNQGGWLTPQWWHGRPYSPMLFRNLYIKGREGLVATGHGDDTILLGETAPIGKSDKRSRSPIAPGTFIRELFCVDAAGNRRSGLGCNAFTENGPLQASAFAHHPYTKALSPLQPDPNPDIITMANLGTLTGLLDAIAAKTGRIQANIPIALTEFGYETNPPDPFHGISLEQQADYNTLAELIAWANPRVITQTQFLLRDVRPLKKYSKTSKARWNTYQSGVLFADGSPKPSAAVYSFPFAVTPVGRSPEGRTRYLLWGQTRWRPNSERDLIYLQFRAAGSPDWAPLGSPLVTGLRNYFSTTVDAPGAGDVRAVAVGPAGAQPRVQPSRTQPVG